MSQSVLDAIHYIVRFGFLVMKREVHLPQGCSNYQSYLQVMITILLQKKRQNYIVKLQLRAVMNCKRADTSCSCHMS